METKIKRKEVQFLINGLAEVKGMKDFMKSISLGRDLRVLKGIQDETDEAIKTCKPDNYDELLSELQELRQKKAQEQPLKEGEILNEQILHAHVILKWPKASEWDKINKLYDDNIKAIRNEQIDVDFHTELTPEDFPKCAEDIAIAEVLSYFLKE